MNSDKTQKPRFIKASIAAAIATLLVPVILALFTFFEGPSTLPDGTPDNAPYRASMILLLATPIIFFILFALWYLVTKGFFFLNKLSKKSLFASCAGLSVLHGVVMAIPSYKMFGGRDAIISFAVFSTATFVSLGIGCFIWCIIGLKGYNQSLNRTVQT